MAVHELQIPLKDSDVAPLRLGDLLYFSGPAFTCRSRLQRYVFDEGHRLPFSTEQRNVLIHSGPIMVAVAGGWKPVSLMPTSSLRFERWGARSVREWGLKAIIGKTTMGVETARAMRERCCVHACPQCVSPNLWLDSIKVEGVYLLDELGSIEAAWQLALDRLGPFMVDIDADGNSYFDRMDEVVAANLPEVYRMLGIPPGFEPTRLWSTREHRKA